IPPTTPGSTRAVSGASAGPNRSESITATGRAPIARMSRTMPPTPVAAPWDGSTYDGWLCDSILKVTAYPWPMSTTPALCPMPASRALPPFTGGALSANWRRYRRDDLYEQCSLHITEYSASSGSVGRRPSRSRIRWYSSVVRPSSRYGWARSGVAAATATVSGPTTLTISLPPSWAPRLVVPEARKIAEREAHRGFRGYSPGQQSLVGGTPQ